MPVQEVQLSGVLNGWVTELYAPVALKEIKNRYDYIGVTDNGGRKRL